MPATPRGKGRRRVGFTLVELLVVVTIIAVLMSIIAPALSGSRDAARAARCLANERTIGVAMIMYTHDHKLHFPQSSHSAGSLVSPAAWLESLVPYGGVDQARRCPSDERADERLTSYATNDHFEPLTPGIDFNPVTGRTLPGGRTRACLRTTDVERPACVVYAVEPSGAGTVDHIHSVGWRLPSQVEGAIDVRRHLGAANYLFVDGHARPIAWAELQRSFSSATSIFDPDTAQ